MPQWRQKYFFDGKVVDGIAIIITSGHFDLEICKTSWRSFLQSEDYIAETPILMDTSEVKSRLGGLENIRDLLQYIYDHLPPVKRPLLFAFVDPAILSNVYFKTLEVVANNPNKFLNVDQYKLDLRFFRERAEALDWLQQELAHRSSIE